MCRRVEGSLEDDYAIVFFSVDIFIAPADDDYLSQAMSFSLNPLLTRT